MIWLAGGCGLKHRTLPRDPCLHFKIKLPCFPNPIHFFLKITWNSLYAFLVHTRSSPPHVSSAPTAPPGFQADPRGSECTGLTRETSVSSVFRLSGGSSTLLSTTLSFWEMQETSRVGSRGRWGGGGGRQEQEVKLKQLTQIYSRWCFFSPPQGLDAVKSKSFTDATTDL